MPLAPIPNVTQVTVQGTMAGGEVWANVLNFLRVGGAAFDSAHAEGLGAQIRSAYAAMQGFLPSTTVLNQFTFRNLAVPGSSPIIQSTVPLAGSGTAADSLPNDVAFVVTIESGEGGRKGRGRIFLPALTKAAITSTAGAGPQWTVAAMTAGADFGFDLASVANPPNCKLVVVSRVDNVAREVIRGYVDSKPDTMKRRDNRLGGVIRTPFTPA